jgi:hypothetical protein
MNSRQHESETKPNGFTKKCRDCNKPIYLHRGTSDRWRAFESVYSPAGTPDEWIRHRCPAGLQDAELMSLIAPAGSKPRDLVAKLKQIIGDFEEIISQAEARIAAETAAANGAAEAAAKTGT